MCECDICVSAYLRILMCVNYFTPKILTQVIMQSNCKYLMKIFYQFLCLKVCHWYLIDLILFEILSLVNNTVVVSGKSQLLAVPKESSNAIQVNASTCTQSPVHQIFASTQTIALKWTHHHNTTDAIGREGNNN